MTRKARLSEEYHAECVCGHTIEQPAALVDREHLIRCESCGRNARCEWLEGRKA
jgi:hypothetical protein